MRRYRIEVFDQSGKRLAKVVCGLANPYDAVEATHAASQILRKRWRQAKIPVDVVEPGQRIEVWSLGVNPSILLRSYDVAMKRWPDTPTG